MIEQDHDFLADDDATLLRALARRSPEAQRWICISPDAGTSFYVNSAIQGRYQDVINLAEVTLTETIAKPTLEESIFWRGRAKYMIGDTPGAVADLRETLRLHPNWPPAVQALQDLGLQP